jgi:hypothetical protein
MANHESAELLNDVNHTQDVATFSNSVAQEEEELNKEFYGDNYQARNSNAPTLVSFPNLILPILGSK